jgi:hypothetical protein
MQFRLWAALVSVVVLSSLLVANTSAQTLVSVPANALPPVDSGVLLDDGESVVVTASGVWSVGGRFGFGDANGATTLSTSPCALLTSAPMRALIGSLDRGLTFFLIGTGPTTVVGPGQLLLSANDCPGPGGAFFTDNTGALLVMLDPIVSETPVAVDIHPGSLPNSINPQSRGVIPAAILTTPTFDATIVDPSSVQFGPNLATVAHSALEDVDGDGVLDMMLHFRTQETGITCGDTSASLTGLTNAGEAIKGSDSIKTVGCK